MLEDRFPPFGYENQNFLLLNIGPGREQIGRAFFGVYRRRTPIMLFLAIYGILVKSFKAPLFF
jgi:hypothetical protein